MTPSSCSSSLPRSHTQTQTHADNSNMQYSKSPYLLYISASSSGLVISLLLYPPKWKQPALVHVCGWKPTLFYRPPLEGEAEDAVLLVSVCLPTCCLKISWTTGWRSFNHCKSQSDSLSFTDKEVSVIIAGSVIPHISTSTSLETPLLKTLALTLFAC